MGDEADHAEGGVNVERPASCAQCRNDLGGLDKERDDLLRYADEEWLGVVARGCRRAVLGTNTVFLSLLCSLLLISVITLGRFDVAGGFDWGPGAAQILWWATIVAVLVGSVTAAIGIAALSTPEKFNHHQRGGVARHHTLPLLIAVPMVTLALLFVVDVPIDSFFFKFFFEPLFFAWLVIITVLLTRLNTRLARRTLVENTINRVRHRATKIVVGAFGVVVGWITPEVDGFDPFSLVLLSVILRCIAFYFILQLFLLAVDFVCVCKAIMAEADAARAVASTG